MKPAIQTLKGIQDHLGDLNDAVLACALLSDFLAQWETRKANLPLDQRQSPAGIAAYLAVKHAERHHLMVTFPATWENFVGGTFSRNLALAVAGI